MATWPRPVTVALARWVRARRSAVLCYHGVGRPARLEDDPELLLVPPERFRAQVEVLLRAGFEFVTVDELAARADGGEPPPGLLALSFDDGMRDNHSVVLPLLEEYGVPATVYVTSGIIGQANPWMAPEAGERMMTAEELRELLAAGIELGAHTVTHPDLSELSYEECLREMVQSRDEIQRLTGARVTTFAYPFCKYGPAAVQAARAAGFRAAVTCWGRGSWAPLEMKRQMVTGADGVPSFLLKLAEAYQPLFESAPSRLFRTGTRGVRQRIRARRVAGG